MSTHFSANQYDQAFAAKRLQNWQVPKRFKERPSTLEGFTRIISNDRGHILEGIPRSSKSPWGDFVGTWEMQKAPLKTETLKTKTMVEKIKTKEKANTSPPTKAIDKEIKTEEKGKTHSPTQGLSEEIKTIEKARTPSPTKVRTPSPQCASPVHGSPSPLNASPIKSPQQCTQSPRQSPQKECTPSPQQTPVDRKSPLQEA